MKKKVVKKSAQQPKKYPKHFQGFEMFVLAFVVAALLLVIVNPFNAFPFASVLGVSVMR